MLVLITIVFIYLKPISRIYVADYLEKISLFLFRTVSDEDLNEWYDRPTAKSRQTNGPLARPCSPRSRSRRRRRAPLLFYLVRLRRVFAKTRRRPGSGAPRRRSTRRRSTTCGARRARRRPSPGPGPISPCAPRPVTACRRSRGLELRRPAREHTRRGRAAATGGSVARLSGELLRSCGPCPARGPPRRGPAGALQNHSRGRRRPSRVPA